MTCRMWSCPEMVVYWILAIVIAFALGWVFARYVLELP